MHIEKSGNYINVIMLPFMLHIITGGRAIPHNRIISARYFLFLFFFRFQAKKKAAIIGKVHVVILFVDDYSPFFFCI